MSGISVDNADRSDQHNGGQADVQKAHYLQRKYEKDATIRIETGFDKVNACDIIECIEGDYGENSVFACVPRGGFYEVTLCDIQTARNVANGVEIRGTSYNSRVVSDKSVVVSFLHLTPYIEDDQIVDYLENLNIKLLSPIKRHFIKDSKRKITDGTRYVRVRFPPTLKSLPYSVRFETCDGPQPFKVLHNGQVKTCNQCFDTDHTVANCPFVECRICHECGHIARDCMRKKCPECRNIRKNCVCDMSDTNEENEMNDQEQTFEGFNLNMSSNNVENVANDWSLSNDKFDESEENENSDENINHEMHDETNSVNVECESETKVCGKMNESSDRSHRQKDKCEKMEKKSERKKDRRSRLVKKMNEGTVKTLAEERKRKTMNDGMNDLENKQKKASGRREDYRMSVEDMKECVSEGKG